MKLSIESLDKDVEIIKATYYGLNLTLLLIDHDTLLDASTQPIAKEIYEQGVCPGKVIISHCHHDHSGGGEYFEKRGSVVYGSKITAGTVTFTTKSYISNFFPTRHQIWFSTNYIEGFIKGIENEFKPIGNITTNFNNLKNIQVIDAGGHTAGGLVVKHGNILFTNDAINGSGITNDNDINMIPQISNFEAYLSLIRKIEEIKPEMIIPSHNYKPFKNDRVLEGSKLTEFLSESKNVAAKLIMVGKQILESEDPLSLGLFTKLLLHNFGIEELYPQAFITRDAILRYIKGVNIIKEGEVEYFYIKK